MGGGQYLYSLLKENKLAVDARFDADGDKLVSFCTLAPLDDVQPTANTFPAQALFIWTAQKHHGYHGTEVHLHFYQSSGCMKKYGYHF